MSDKNRERLPENNPVAWFVVLEVARQKGDFTRAAEAQRELDRLGVTVRFQGLRKARKAVRGAH